MTNSIELWGAGTVRTHRTLWMAHEIGLTFTHMPIEVRTGETKEPGYLALNPRHKVPLLRHGEVVLTESAAILIYMTETFDIPGHIFRAGNMVQRARHLEWCFFIMSELDANGLYTMRRHGPLKHLYGDAPVAVDGGQTYFLYQLERMERQARAAAPLLMGERLSPADVLFASCLDWALRYDIPLPAYLMDYFYMMAARPAYRAATEMNEV